jgi:hypothetical protein
VNQVLAVPVLDVVGHGEQSGSETIWMGNAVEAGT